MTEIKNADTPASPTHYSSFTNAYGGQDELYSDNEGLSKREAFAKDLPHIDVEFGDINEMCKFVQKEEVPISSFDILVLSFEVEAKIRVMRADALLNELSKESK